LTDLSGYAKKSTANGDTRWASGCVCAGRRPFLGRCEVVARRGLETRLNAKLNLQDVRRLRLDLEPWRDTHSVRELDEQLAAVGGAR
jgi:hypothetical protein